MGESKKSHRAARDRGRKDLALGAGEKWSVSKKSMLSLGFSGPPQSRSSEIQRWSLLPEGKTQSYFFPRRLSINGRKSGNRLWN